MDKKLSFVLLLAVGAGFLGGVVSSFLFTVDPVFAQVVKEPFFSRMILTQSLGIIDEDKNILAAFSAAKGFANLTFLGTNKAPLLSAGTGENGWGMFALDKDGVKRLTVDVHNDGVPKVALFDEGGDQRMTFHLINGDPALRLFDTSGAALAIADNNSGWEKVTLGVSSKGKGQLLINGKSYGDL